MRRLAMLKGILGLLLAMAPPVRAGLYNTAEQPPGPLTRNFKDFREKVLIPFRQIGSTEVHTELNRRYGLIASVWPGARGGPGLTVEERLDMSAYLVRALKPREAVNVLAPAQRQEDDPFLVLANLATAEFLDGQPLRAASYQADAVRLWPKDWSALKPARRTWLQKVGWQPRDFAWYREAETYQLRLVRLRAREAARQTTGLPDDVDALFSAEGKTPVAPRFVGENGRFEAGKLAAAERAKLPKNAIEIVEQLLVWMPHDMRLYWLLGELFNAEGDVGAAKSIFEEIVVKWNPQTSKAAQVAGTGFQRDPSLPKLFKEHLDVLRAQPLAEPTVAEPTTAPAPASPPQEPAAPPVEWRSLGIGFGTGLLVAFFGYWQIRELRRRRQARTIVSKGLS
jgi:hypothetical protein